MSHSSLPDWLTAVGTIAVAIVAVWGHWFKAKFFPTRATLEPQNLRGIVTHFTNGPDVIYYHLKVVNKRPYFPLRNCRVLLVAIARRGSDMQFRPEPMPVPYQLMWAPAETMPALTSVHAEQAVDLGFLTKPDASGADRGHFRPALYVGPDDFEGCGGPNEAVRYSLRIEADGAATARQSVVEVAWDGQWTTDLDKLSHHLTVRMLPT